MKYEMTLNETDIELPAVFPDRNAMMDALRTAILDDDDWSSVFITVSFVPSWIRGDDRGAIEIVSVYHADMPNEPVIVYCEQM